MLGFVNLGSVGNELDWGWGTTQQPPSKIEKLAFVGKFMLKMYSVKYPPPFAFCDNTFTIFIITMRLIILIY